jgi:hypothetical protein
MAVNTLGGPLEFDLVINTDALPAASAQITQDLDKIGNKAKEAATKQQESIAGIINSFAQGTTPAVDAVIAKIQQLQDEEAKLEKQISGTKDVGQLNAYKTSLAQIQQELNSAPAQLYNAVLQTIEKQGIATGTTVADSMDNAGQKAVSALAQLRKIKSELVLGGDQNPQFDALLSNATDLEKRIKNVNKELELSSSNVSGLEALKQGVQGLIGGFTALAGVTGLMAKDDKELQASINTVVSAMAVLNGVEEIGKVLSKESALNVFLLAQYRKLTATATAEQAVATETLDTALVGETAATEAATAATDGLTVAMEANPAGVLLLVLSALVIAIQSYISSMKNAAEEQADLNNRLTEANNIMGELSQLYVARYKEASQQAENAVALAEAQGAGEQKILSLKQQALNAKRQENVAILADLGYMDLRGNTMKQQLEYKRAELVDALEELGALKQSKGVDEDRLKLAQSKVDLIKSQVGSADESLKAIQDADAQTAAIRAEAGKKAYDDALKSAAALAEARVILAKKYTEQERDLEILAIRARTKVELDNANITAGERAKILAQQQQSIEDANRKFLLQQISDQKSLTQARLAAVKDGSAEELALRIQILQEDAQKELAQEDITANRRKEIEATLAKGIHDLRQKFSDENYQAEIKTRIASIDGQLSIVEEGSREELELRKKKIDEANGLEILAAARSKSTTELYAAQVFAIYAKSAADKKKLDDEYVDHVLQNQLKLIQSTTDSKNIPLEIQQNKPGIQIQQNIELQRQVLTNNLEGLRSQQKLVAEAIANGNGNMDKLKTQSQELENSIKKAQGAIDNLDAGKFAAVIKDAASKVGQLSSALSGLASSLEAVNPALAASVQQMSSLSGVTSDALSAISSYASGDFASAFSSGVKSVSGIIDTIQKAKDSAKKAVDEVALFNLNIAKSELDINAIYRDRARIQAQINESKLSGIQAESDLLKKQKNQVAKDYQDVLDQIAKQTFTLSEEEKKNRGIGSPALGALGLLFGSHSTVDKVTESLAGKSFDDLNKLFLSGQLDDKAKTLFQELEKLKQEGVDIDAALEANKVKAQELFTGTTADSITSSIVDGFKNGLRSASDFADNFQQLMQNAVLQALKFQSLEEPLNAFYKDFADKSASGGVLTQQEIEQLRSNFNSIISNAGQKFDELKKITNLDFTTSGGSGGSSLSGAIKGITEQQADLLAGQFGGLRITAADNLRVVTESLNVLNNIASYTQHLINVDRVLSKFELTGIKMI